MRRGDGSRAGTVRQSRWRKTPPADAAELEIDATRALSPRALAVLQKELKFRRRCNEFSAASRKEYHPQIDKAQEACQAAEEKIRAGLVKLGYIEASPTEQVVGKITPAMVLSHPAVRAAKDLFDSLVNKSRNIAFRRENDIAIDQIISRLNRARQTAVNGP